MRLLTDNQLPISEIETVGLLPTLVMGAFLAIATLIVVSVFCKVLLAVGLVPSSPKSWTRRTIVWLANVVGQAGIAAGRSGRRGRATPPASGGSSGGGGATGKY
jgi:uncharacterized membrane protein YgcG